MVADPDGTVILDVSPILGIGNPIQRHRNIPISPFTKQLSGTVATVAIPGAENFYHFLFDLLPRLHLLELAGYDRLNLDSIVVNALSEPFQRELLAQFPFPMDMYIETSPEQNLSAELLVVPSLPRRFVRGSWVYRFLRDRLGSDGARDTTAARIYISRAKANRRRLRATPRFRAVLSERGFQEVVLEELPFFDQVRLVAGADVVMGDHGAGLSHIVFCKPDALVVEILSPAWPRPHFWAIARQLRLRYGCLFGHRPVRTLRPRHWGASADFWIDCNELDVLLDQLDVCRINPQMDSA